MPGISTLSIIPVRKEPSDRSEMVTQVLFGETFDVLESKESWSRVQLHYDQYIGWVDSKQITLIDDTEIAEISSNPLTVSLDLLQIAIEESYAIPIVMGSTLPSYEDKKFHIGQKKFSFEGRAKELAKPNLSELVQSCYLYFNAPYLWGGRSPFGIDCSGFTQMVFKLCGIRLKRDANEQALQGTAVNALNDAKEGDLAFFKNKEEKIIHTGIVLSGGRIIHASGKVRIDKLDEQGIFNQERNLYSHNFASIKRMF